jgi:hypothetical protein
LILLARVPQARWFPPRCKTSCRAYYLIDDAASVMLAVLRVCATEENAADVSFALSNSHTSPALVGILQGFQDRCGSPDREEADRR